MTMPTAITLAGMWLGLGIFAHQKTGGGLFFIAAGGLIVTYLVATH